jgi:anthranilate synthase/aminodeoxychorismate synthase-like glutamine amidotransferase
MILLIDNYDSFVYNLARYFERLGLATRVVRNDVIDASEIRELAPQAIVISPGPCTPAEAGCSVEVVEWFRGRIPILGVCLGHQAIATAYGGRIVQATQPMHGRSSPIRHSETSLFQGIAQQTHVARYHSLVAEPDSFAAPLLATAWTDDGTIMAVEDIESGVFGLQFHPESILTSIGYSILVNFLRLADIAVSRLPEDMWNLEYIRPRSPEPPSRQTPLTH